MAAMGASPSVCAVARQSASFRGLLCRHLSGVGGGAWRPALAVPEPVVDRDAGLWTGWCQRAAIANGYPTRLKGAGLWTGWCQRAAIANGYPTRRKDAVIAATSWNGWCQRAATANGYPTRRKDGHCCHLLDRVVSARCYCKWLPHPAQGRGHCSHLVALLRVHRRRPALVVVLVELLRAPLPQWTRR